METKTFQKIYFLTIVILLLFLCFTISYVYKNKQYLLQDPLIHGLNIRYPQGNVTCTCLHNWDGYKQEAFGFNKTNQWMLLKWYDFMGSGE